MVPQLSQCYEREGVIYRWLSACHCVTLCALMHSGYCTELCTAREGEKKTTTWPIKSRRTCVWHWLRSSPLRRPHALQIDCRVRQTVGTLLELPHMCPPAQTPPPLTLNLSFRHPIGTKKNKKNKIKHAIQSSHCWNCNPATQRTRSFPDMTSHCLFAIIKD